MGDKPISFRDADGNFVSAADVWNEKKLEELFNRLNPNRALRLARTKKENPSQYKISENSVPHQTRNLFILQRKMVERIFSALQSTFGQLLHLRR